MRIKTVYLAGGINGLTDGDATDWRTEAKRLLPREIGVLDPMSRDYRGKEDDNVDAIISGDKDDIAQCQAIIANCPRPSWGTAMEIGWAYANFRPDDNQFARLRIVAIVPAGTPVSPWLRYHTDAVVETLEAAVAQVVAWSA